MAIVNNNENWRITVMAIDSARSMKKVLRFLFGLLINVCILFILVKGFSYSFDFAYQVFATTAAESGSNKKTAVTITEDEPLLDVATSLQEAGVIDNRYAFILKVRINGDAGKIQAGTYSMSPKNTNQEIIDMITGVAKKDDDSEGSDSSSTGDESGSAETVAPNATGTGDEGAGEDRTTEAATDNTDETDSADSSDGGAGADDTVEAGE